MRRREWCAGLLDIYSPEGLHVVLPRLHRGVAPEEVHQQHQQGHGLITTTQTGRQAVKEEGYEALIESSGKVYN